MKLSYKKMIILASLLLLIPQVRCLVFTIIALVLTVIQISIMLYQTYQLEKTSQETKLVYSKIMEIGHQLNDIEKKLDSLNNFIVKEVMSAIYKIHKELTLNEVLGDIDFICRMHDMLQRFLTRRLLPIIHGVNVSDVLLSDYTLQDFAVSIVSYSPRSVASKISKINDHILGTMESSTFRDMRGALYRQALEFYKNGTFDNAFATANQLIFSLFTMVHVAQMKAYTLTQFAYLILQRSKNESFEAEIDMMKDMFLEYLINHTKEVMDVLSLSSNIYYKGDKDRGDRYMEVTKLTKTRVILNEADLTRTNTCWGNCADYDYTWQYRCHDSEGEHCQMQQRCLGRVTGCYWVAGGGAVCSPPNRSNHRRYNSVLWNGKSLIGRTRDNCKWRRVDSWLRFPVICSYCYCWCDDSNDGDSYRFFNKRPVVSDIENNKIITGIRLRQVENVFHIQIQEGEVTEMYGINVSSVAWQKSISYHTSNAKNGEDYHAMTPDSCTVHLDDIALPVEYFLTGVKFVTVEGNLQLAIRGTKFSNSDHSHKSEWFNEKPVSGRQTIITAFDIPIFYDNTQISRNNSRITFKTSGKDGDVQQTAIPYLDAQDVAPLSSFPLVGAGIYLRTHWNSGGFIGLKVLTYNASLEIEGLPKKAMEMMKENVTLKAMRNKKTEL